jgi:hypothetical protein
MRQKSLEVEGFEKYRKKTSKEQCLDDMEQIIPWKALCAVIDLYYPKPQGTGEEGRSGWSGCCGFTFCSIGSSCLPRARWKPCTTRAPSCCLWA